MTNDLISYLQKLYAYVESQEKRIIRLEQTIKKIKEDTKMLKERPSLKVDKIEYKFDQLKVETLDGTLNIGLNPSDLQNIEEFAVNNQEIKKPISPKNQMQRSLAIENAIYRYLETDLPNVVAEEQRKYNMPLDETYLSFIKEDIVKQLPMRIDYYIKQFQASNRGDELNENMDEDVIQQLIKDIQNGVQTFISHLPENMKGMRTE